METTIFGIENGFPFLAILPNQPEKKIVNKKFTAQNTPTKDEEANKQTNNK